MRTLQELALKKGVWLVEDAAHAHGSSFDGRYAGTFGVAGSFSFYPTKVMTAGEGGMIVTDDDRIAAEARMYRDQGKLSFSQNTYVRMGYNWRMSELHAIVGIKHLERLPAMIQDRQKIAALYNVGLTGCRNLRSLEIPPNGACNYYKYIVVVSQKLDRKAVKTRLREAYGISLAGEVYEAPLHKQPIFERYGSYHLPVSEDLCSRHICLPVFSGMEETQAHRVIRGLKEVFE
jgi:dTDP-4-amino-4,6-dideoxygalactose transaminase